MFIFKRAFLFGLSGITVEYPDSSCTIGAVSIASMAVNSNPLSVSRTWTYRVGKLKSAKGKIYYADIFIEVVLEE